MAEHDIIQQLIHLAGQSQAQRTAVELGVHYADVDERSRKDLMLLASRFAKFVNYYQDNITAPAGTWEAFFTYEADQLDQLLTSEDGSVSPHLALYQACLEMYREPQAYINRITERHLDFYYKDVLRFAPLPASPDKAHVVLELKKNASAVRITPAIQFSAGKDATGVELIYAPTSETIINSASVTSLRSLYLDGSSKGTVRAAPIANSADGLGAELTEDDASWSGFGDVQLPAAEIGFALASPVLRLREGMRKITLSLHLNDVDRTVLSDSALSGSFEVFLTGEKNWLGPFSVSPTINASNVMQLGLTLGESEGAVVDYAAGVHGYTYAAQAPVIQLRLKSSNSVGYLSFRGVTLASAKISVEVSNIISLNLENDDGTLDPKKAFMPFGAQPTAKSRFLIGCDEALGKKLDELTISLQWKDAPSSFSSLYADYDVSVSNSSFTTSVSFNDGGNWHASYSGQALFDSSNATAAHTLQFSPNGPSVSATPSTGMRYHALYSSGAKWARYRADSFMRWNPVYAAYLTHPLTATPGFITLSLDRDFLHATYRKKYVEKVLSYSKSGTGTPTILNEPYTPTLQSISLGYKAHSDEVSLDTNSLNAFTNADLWFYHLTYFGQMREHAYQRYQFDFVSDKRVSLLPSYTAQGELLVGLAALNPQDSVSVLFQVAEGSADPDLPAQAIQWSALCDNYWKPLGSSELISDSTNQLLTSGIIKFVIPAEATTSNTILPAGLIWLKAAVAGEVGAVSRLIAVMANAVALQFIDNGNDPQHLSTALASGKIAKLKTAIAAVKTITQPYASFGGQQKEGNVAFHTRVSERLRHKNRAVTPWDYERLILNAFPKVHKVKCIPHASDTEWLAPGHVMLVVVPDLRNRNAVNPLQPKVDADTISRITQFIQQHIGMQVAIKVKNPNYQKLQVAFKVQFKTGYEFNYYRNALEQELIAYLSPWAYTDTQDLQFGGKVYKSVILDFVEERDYVDYVTDFKLYSYSGDSNPYNDVSEVSAETPDTILVSDATHVIDAVS
jgi:hypothetical protein